MLNGSPDNNTYTSLFEHKIFMSLNIPFSIPASLALLAICKNLTP